MKVTVIGAGNSGLAMAAHLGINGNQVILWNRTVENISKLIKTKTIYCHGVNNEAVRIDQVTNDIGEALDNPDVILITTPANAHRDLAKIIGQNIKSKALIVLNPGRTFGALEFKRIFDKYNNKCVDVSIAETQTIVYTCRKIDDETVDIISFKPDVLISTFNPVENSAIINRLPKCLQSYFIPAKSMIETSIGNVGMILHCAPLLLNTGWVENINYSFKYYHEGISSTIGELVEKIDVERVEVSTKLGLTVETTKAWIERTYGIKGENLYAAIQKNEAYNKIEAPNSLNHRYILEDVPCGLVPLESIGQKLGLKMKYTGLIIELASAVTGINFRQEGRTVKSIFEK